MYVYGKTQKSGYTGSAPHILYPRLSMLLYVRGETYSKYFHCAVFTYTHVTHGTYFTFQLLLTLYGL